MNLKIKFNDLSNEYIKFNSLDVANWKLYNFLQVNNTWEVVFYNEKNNVVTQKIDNKNYQITNSSWLKVFDKKDILKETKEIDLTKSSIEEILLESKETFLSKMSDACFILNDNIEWYDIENVFLFIKKSIKNNISKDVFDKEFSDYIKKNKYVDWSKVVKNIFKNYSFTIISTKEDKIMDKIISEYDILIKDNYEKEFKKMSIEYN